MDELKALGVDAAVVFGIVAITQGIKALDTQNKFKRLYIIIPTVLGAFAALFVTEPFSWQDFGRNALVYIGAATYVYSAGRKMIFSKGEGK